MPHLYQFLKEAAEPRFCLVENNIIRNDKYWLSWHHVTFGDVVMFIEKLAYTENTASAAAAAGLVRAARAVAQGAFTSISADWNKAWDLWDKNKSIPGAIYLHPQGQLIWISDIDIKYFHEIMPESKMIAGNL